MTFVKDPLNATNPREIIEYSQDLEDRIEVGFDDVADYVIEQGSNFTKWASGRLECWGGTSLTNGMNIADGALFSGPMFTITFPKSFISNPIVNTTFVRDTDRVGFISIVGWNNTSFSARATTTKSFGTGYPYYVNWIAIGRWK